MDDMGEAMTESVMPAIFVEFHADDFGLFTEQSRRILECTEKGALNGISVIVNGPELEKAMELLTDDARKKLRIALHIDLAEGYPLSAEARGVLTGDEGVFNCSFFKLFTRSLMPGRRGKLRAALTAEIGAQIDRFLEFMPEGYRLRVDSHIHFHMIPLVFKCMMDALGERSIEPEYIRISREERSVYAPGIRGGLIGKPIPINRIKVMVLNLFAAVNLKRYPDLNHGAFSGVMYSGKMDIDVVRAALPELIRYAGRKSKDVEILFHPGDVREAADLEKVTNSADLSFFRSPGREAERRALMEIGSLPDEEIR